MRREKWCSAVRWWADGFGGQTLPRALVMGWGGGGGACPTWLGLLAGPFGGVALRYCTLLLSVESATLGPPRDGFMEGLSLYYMHGWEGYALGMHKRRV